MKEHEFKDKLNKLRLDGDDRGVYWLQVTYAYSNRLDGIDYGDKLTDSLGQEFVIDEITASGFNFGEPPQLIYHGKTESGDKTFIHQNKITNQ